VKTADLLESFSTRFHPIANVFMNAGVEDSARFVREYALVSRQLQPLVETHRSVLGKPTCSFIDGDRRRQLVWNCNDEYVLYLNRARGIGIEVPRNADLATAWRLWAAYYTRLGAQIPVPICGKPCYPDLPGSAKCLRPQGHDAIKPDPTVGRDGNMHLLKHSACPHCSLGGETQGGCCMCEHSRNSGIVLPLHDSRDCNLAEKPEERHLFTADYLKLLDNCRALRLAALRLKLMEARS
jgi:hypothetical protein